MRAVRHPGGRSASEGHTLGSSPDDARRRFRRPAHGASAAPADAALAPGSPAGGGPAHLVGAEKTVPVGDPGSTAISPGAAVVDTGAAVTSPTTPPPTPARRGLPHLGGAVSSFRRQWAGDALLRNSVWLMTNMVMLSGLGFMFWVIAGRLVPPSSVGTVTTSMSTLTLLSTAGALGLPVALVPYLARFREQSRAILLKGLAASCAATFVVTLVAVFTPVRPPYAAEGITAAIIVVAMAVATTFGSVQDAAFLAAHKAHLLLLKNGVSGFGKIALFLALSPGTWGRDATRNLMLIQLVGIVVPALIAWWLQQRGVLAGPVHGGGEQVREMTGFALHNYGAALVSMLPSTISPLLVIHLLGKEEAAFFNMPMMLLALLNVVPNSVAQSLLAANSADSDRVRNLKRSFLMTYAVLVPAVLVVVVAARWALLVFGRPYADNATHLLQWLAVGALASAVSYIANSAINAARDGRGFLLLVSVNAVLVLAAIGGVGSRGLTAIGMAWVGAQVISALAAGAYLLRHRERILGTRAVS